MYYANGVAVERDDEKAFSYVKKAADKGDASALHTLGVFYLIAVHVQKDVREAVKYLQFAVEKGSDEAAKKLDDINNNKCGWSPSDGTHNHTHIHTLTYTLKDVGWDWRQEDACPHLVPPSQSNTTKTESN